MWGLFEFLEQSSALLQENSLLESLIETRLHNTINLTPKEVSFSAWLMAEWPIVIGRILVALRVCLQLIKLGGFLRREGVSRKRKNKHHVQMETS